METRSQWMHTTLDLFCSTSLGLDIQTLCYDWMLGVPQHGQLENMRISTMIVDPE